ncbi:MAG: 50S ribosomal protein L19 [Pseudobdellovibrionaceae bacterium]
MAKTPKVKERKSKAGKAAVTETNLVRLAVKKSANTKIQTFRSGDTVNVFVKVKEGEKERIQTYKGIVTKLQGSGAGRSFTVRKVSAGVGVERTFPFLSSILDKVELVSSGKTRRSKLYYLRDLDGKAAKIESELAAKQSAKEVAAALEA